MIIIYLAFSFVGLIGAKVGSLVAAGSFSGRRLYGLMIFDTVNLLVMSKLLKIEVGKFGDFIAPAIMATCASSKIDCLINNCCVGIIMYNMDGIYVKFPSAFVEMTMWTIFVVLLLIIEKKGNVSGMMWPISMIWFGTARYLVDFLRGSNLEKIPILFGMPGGRLWSLVALIIGIIFLYFTLKNKLERLPKVSEFFKSIVGAKFM